MKLFPHAHATHPDWRMAAGLVLAQLRAQMALPDYASAPTLGLLYITDHYASAAQELLAHLGAELPEVTDWSGTVGVGIAANNVEYFGEPALSVMLCGVPAHQYRVFSGVAPLSSGPAMGFEPHTALLHADSSMPDVTELIGDMAQRMASGYLFGGLSSSRSQTLQFAVAGNGNIKGHGAASGVFHGGMSGVAFTDAVRLVSRVTQGCLPLQIGGKPAQHTITACEGHVVTQLDGEPALAVLLRDLGVSLQQPHEAVEKVRHTLVGLSATRAGSDDTTVGRSGHFGADVKVRHIIGLDGQNEGVALGEQVQPGMRLVFCERNREAARADLMRVCAEIREELEPEELTLAAATALQDAELFATPRPERRIAGAVYVSCAGRGGPHFGAPSAELQIVRRALGDVPLVGFFAGGEIARHHLYGYTGVLTVFAG
ncbi:MAG: FIST signal transduction protein [Burkholderiales bacterium]